MKNRLNSGTIVHKQARQSPLAGQAIRSLHGSYENKDTIRLDRDEHGAVGRGGVGGQNSIKSLLTPKTKRARLASTRRIYASSWNKQKYNGVALSKVNDEHNWIKLNEVDE
jgi:hypothetical protein